MPELIFRYLGLSDEEIVAYTVAYFDVQGQMSAVEVAELKRLQDTEKAKAQVRR